MKTSGTAMRDEAGGLAAISDLTGLGHAESPRVPQRREDARARLSVNLTAQQPLANEAGERVARLRAGHAQRVLGVDVDRRPSTGNQAGMTK